MGDTVSMVEQVAEQIDEEKAAQAAKRLESGRFDFNDFLEQMKLLQNLGPLDGLLGMLPGFNKIKKQLPSNAFDPRRVKHMEAIVLSMTPLERRRPEIIKGTRRKRIAGGSGRSLVEVNQLLKQFGMMRKMMKSKGKMRRMMNQLGAMGGGGVGDMLGGGGPRRGGGPGLPL